MYDPKPEHIENAENIILKVINKRIVVDSLELNDMAKKVLNVVYSIGGDYSEATIRKVSGNKIKEWFNL